MKKETPILFSSLMIQALLAGRKTQTRRIINPQPIDNREVDGNFFDGKHRGYVKVDGHPNWKERFAQQFCKYKPGDIIWVRESWAPNQNDGGYYYKADVPTNEMWPLVKWKPSIHMPKDAARIWLEVENVSVERLQDIKTIDAIDEGIEIVTIGGNAPCKKWKNYQGRAYHEGVNLHHPQESFRTLWQSINGTGSWEENPWVWVIKFKVLSTTGKPENL